VITSGSRRQSRLNRAHAERARGESAQLVCCHGDREEIGGPPQVGLKGDAPYRIALPSCESGRLAAAGADELLGLSAALLPLGTAGIVASPVPVNDQAAVSVMLALHAELRRGASMGEALCAARATSQASALSFVAFGAR
jgi:hypothetical protein